MGQFQKLGRGNLKNKKPTAISRFLLLRRVRDSNPRTCYSQQFSRLPQSTTLPTLPKLRLYRCFQWCKYRTIFNSCKTFQEQILTELNNRLEIKGIISSYLFSLLFTFIVNFQHLFNSLNFLKSSLNTLTILFSIATILILLNLLSFSLHL